MKIYLHRFLYGLHVINCCFFTKLIAQRLSCDLELEYQGNLRSCFNLQRQVLNFYDAGRFCRSNDAILATIVDEAVNSALTSQLIALNLNSIVLGLHETLHDWSWQNKTHSISLWHQGCYEQSVQPSSHSIVMLNNNLNRCSYQCSIGNYSYALLKNTLCVCQTSEPSYNRPVNCTTVCPGDVTQRCGSRQGYSVMNLRGVFSEWGKNQPDDAGLYQTCAVLETSTLHWSDVRCAEFNAVICELSDNLTICKSPNIIVGNNCLHIMSSVLLSYFEATQYCFKMNQTLVRVSSRQSYLSIRDYIHRQNYSSSGINFWIGLTRSSWTWESFGEDLEYSNWLPGSPNGRTQSCAVLESSGYWRDVACNSKHRFFCENRFVNDVAIFPRGKPSKIRVTLAPSFPLPTTSQPLSSRETTQTTLPLRMRQTEAITTTSQHRTHSIITHHISTYSPFLATSTRTSHPTSSSYTTLQIITSTPSSNEENQVKPWYSVFLEPNGVTLKTSTIVLFVVVAAILAFLVIAGFTCCWIKRAIAKKKTGGSQSEDKSPQFFFGVGEEHTEKFDTIERNVRNSLILSDNDKLGTI